MEEKKTVPVFGEQTEPDRVPVTFEEVKQEPVFKETFTVKEVNDLISTVAQYIIEDIDVKQWYDKMIKHCGYNPMVFNHATRVITDALLARYRKLYM